MLSLPGILFVALAIVAVIGFFVMRSSAATAVRVAEARGAASVKPTTFGLKQAMAAFKRLVKLGPMAQPAAQASLVVLEEVGVRNTVAADASAFNADTDKKIDGAGVGIKSAEDEIAELKAAIAKLQGIIRQLQADKAEVAEVVAFFGAGQAV